MGNSFSDHIMNMLAQSQQPANFFPNFSPVGAVGDHHHMNNVLPTVCQDPHSSYRPDLTPGSSSRSNSSHLDSDFSPLSSGSSSSLSLGHLQELMVRIMQQYMRIWEIKGTVLYCRLDCR